MTEEEYKEKYEPLVTDPFKFKSVTAVNHRPHPFTVGPKHVAHAADYHGGTLGEETLKAIPCAVPGCRIGFEEHTYDRVMFLELIRNTKHEDAKQVLLNLGKHCEDDGIDGFCFVETPEKFRIKESVA